MAAGRTVLISKICWVELRASTGLKMSEGAALQETSIGSSRLTIGNIKTLFRQLVSVCIAFICSSKVQALAVTGSSDFTGISTFSVRGV